MAEDKKSYTAEDIKVLEGLEGVRKRFDVVEISKKIKRKGDILILSSELHIKPRILQEAVSEGRVLSFFPNLDKSKAGILNALRTNRELKLFSENHDIYTTPARKLIKLVRQWRQDVQKNPSLLVSQEEHDLILGSLMGDASVRQREKNSCFRVAHSIKQEGYINFKLNLLKNFNISEFEKRKRIIHNLEVDMIHLSTKTHSVFNYYRNIFYKNEIKTINQEILNQLNARSLAYWICDDGSYCNSLKYLILCTNSYTLEEHKLMKQFFEDKFGLSPTIGFRDKKYYFLRFKKNDSGKLIEIVRPFIPECMKYKIGEMKND